MKERDRDSFRDFPGYLQRSTPGINPSVNNRKTSKMQRFNHSTPPHTCSYLWEIRNPPPTAGNPESVTVTHSLFTHRIQFLPFLVLILSLGGALHNPRDPTTLARGPRSAGVSVGPSQQPHSRPPCFAGHWRRRAWDNPKERMKKSHFPSHPIPS